MKTVLNPLHNYVIAKAKEVDKKTSSGILLPESAKEKPRTAVVLSVGKDVKEIKVKDQIIYKSYSTTEIKVDSDEFILVKEEDVLATVKEPKK